MSATAKFLFDADFGSKAPPPKIDVATHEAAVKEAEARAYASGMAAAEAQARTEAERRTALAMENIGATLDRLTASFAQVERKLEMEAVEVATAVAKKLAHALIERDPLAEIAELATNCLRELRSAPHVAVRVNETLHEQVQTKLAEIASARGFEGKLVVLGETDVAPGDCRLEWADGGMVRDRAATEALIDEAVARYLAAHPGDGTGNTGGS